MILFRQLGLKVYPGENVRFKYLDVNGRYGINVLKIKQGDHDVCQFFLLIALDLSIISNKNPPLFLAFLSIITNTNL